MRTPGLRKSAWIGNNADLNEIVSPGHGGKVIYKL